MTQGFPKAVRLRTRREFSRFSTPQLRFVGKAIIIEALEQQLGVTRLGITVSKRFGKANQRNRFKRIVREAFRRCLSQLPIGLDINVKPRNEAYEASTPAIEQELFYLLNSPHEQAQASRAFRPQSRATSSSPHHRGAPTHTSRSR